MMKLSVLAVALLAVAGMASAAMVVPNGNFQTGDLTGWTSSSSPAAVVTANAGPAGAGDYAVYINNDWSNALITAGNYSVDYPSGFTPGTQYTFQFDLKNLSSGTGKHMNLAVSNSSQGAIASMDIAQTAQGAGWTTQTINFTAPSNGIVCIVVAGSGGGAKTLYLDNMVFTPEPATMSVLALGGLLAIRRRRIA